MKASYKKWILLGAFGLLIAAGAVALWKVTPGGRGAKATGEQPIAENPDHELKALAMELEKKPGHTPVLMRMAQIEREKGKLEDAAQHLREAVNSEPANVDARLELGRVLYERGDVGGAIAETQKILESDPKHVDALYNLGAIYANLGDSQRARSYWSKAVEVGRNADGGKKAREALAKLGGS